jgi:hypothetical protein
MEHSSQNSATARRPRANRCRFATQVPGPLTLMGPHLSPSVAFVTSRAAILRGVGRRDAAPQIQSLDNNFVYIRRRLHDDVLDLTR